MHLTEVQKTFLTSQYDASQIIILPSCKTLFEILWNSFILGKDHTVRRYYNVLYLKLIWLL